MVTGGGFSISGADETANAFKALVKELDSVQTESIQEICDLIVEKAQGHATVDTGFMRDNIKTTEVTEDHGVVTSEADYSIYVEDGTSKMSAQPFMEPARQEVEREARAMVLNKLTTAITRHFK